MDPLRRYGLPAAAALSAVAWAGMSAAGHAYALLPGLAALALAAAALTVASPRRGALAASLLGLGCSAYLLSRKSATDGNSACNIDQTINCDVVNTSVYSEIAGVPIALLGVAFFAGLAAAILFTRTAGNPDTDHRVDQLTAWAGAGGVAYSAFLAWASAQLGAFCVVCITIYAATGILLWAGLAGLRAAGRPFGRDPAGLVTSGPFRSLLVVAGVALLIGLRASPTSQPAGPIDRAAPDATAQLKRLYDAVPAAISLRGTEPTLGARTPTYTILEFADYGCPHCARAKKELEDLVAARPDVQVRFKYFPLDGACNPVLPAPETPGPAPRCDAARAAECAHGQGRFWEMSGQLFTNQGYFSPEQIGFMAQEIGLDMEAFAACMRSDTTDATIRDAAQVGGDLNLSGTPAIYLRGLFGDQWVLTRGVPAALTLIEAHADGVALTPP